MSIYMYGYTLADAPHQLEGRTGIDDRNLFLVTSGKVSAVVSDYPHDKLQVRGKDIFAHQQALRQLMEEASIIPLQFGLTVRDLSKVGEILARNRGYLTSELGRIYRKVEMEVAVRFDTDELLDYMISKYPHLREEKARFSNGYLVCYLGDRARKCERFEKALETEKQICAAKVEEIIGPWCAEISRSRVELGETDVAVFSCLVNRERLKVFQRSIYEAGGRLAPDLAFTYNGPWAPQNFCNLSRIQYA